MTRKDYIAAAELVRDVRIGRVPDGVNVVTARRLLFGTFAAFFAADNPRFDRSRFAAACGVDDV